MNQILYVEKKQNKKQTTLEIDKILKFFAIALLVFGVAFVGEGTYATIKNSEYTKQIANTAPVASIEREGQYIIIRATHIKPIESITYNWNGNQDEAVVIDGQNRTSITEKVELPAGDNTFNIVISDVTGKSTTYNKEFSIETGRDIAKPKIDMTIVGNYIKLTITDETELSYVTYRWNEEDEKEVKPTGADNKKIEINVDILKGKNTFTVIAVDSSNNTTTREETFEGRTKPTIEVYADGDSFLIIAKHDTAIDHIEYNLNGQDYTVNYTPGPEMQYRQKMAEGYNKIVVKAYSTEDTVETYEGEYTYTPGQ